MPHTLSHYIDYCYCARMPQCEHWCHRRQLQAKEEALADASDKLADMEQHMHSLAAKYDKTLARLAEDRKAVTAEEAERDAEEAALLRSREQAGQAKAAAKARMLELEEQVGWLHSWSKQAAFVCVPSSELCLAPQCAR